MADDDKAKEEAYLNENFGGGWLGPSADQVHDYVEHQNDVQVVNDVHTEHDSPDLSAAEFGTAAFNAASVGYEAAEGDPMAIAEAGAAAIDAVMDPHGQEVEKRLGEYGGTLPDGGLPDSSGSGSQ